MTSFLEDLDKINGWKDFHNPFNSKIPSAEMSLQQCRFCLIVLFCALKADEKVLA